MKKTNIYNAYMKLSPAKVVTDQLTILFAFQENEWFAPTNKTSESYSSCLMMADLHLIAVKRTPEWRQGSFNGLKVEFLYNKDLNYDTRGTAKEA